MSYCMEVGSLLAVGSLLVVGSLLSDPNPGKALSLYLDRSWIGSARSEML